MATNYKLFDLLKAMILRAFPKTGGTIEGDVGIDGILKFIKNGAYIAGTTTDGRALGQFTPLNASNDCIIGYGGYDQSVGATRIFGRDITFTSPAAGLVNRSYGVNKVLWSGGVYMLASQTATLSEAVSAQPHGIVLVFSDYTDGVANDFGWNYFFVPKYAISKGRMVVHMHTGALFGRLGAKNLYINNTSIVGHEDNYAAGTGSGVNYVNNRFVLRYVIGV